MCQSFGLSQVSHSDKGLISIVALVFLSILPLFMSNGGVIENSSSLYFSLFIVGVAACYRKDSLSHLVTPNALIFFYFIINFLLGSWGFANEYILVQKNLYDFNDWRYRQITTSLSMLCPALFLATDILYHRKYELLSAKTVWMNHNGKSLVGVIFLIPFFFLPLNLDSIGAQGDLAILPKGIVAIALILYLSKFDIFKRCFGYGFLIVLFASFSSDEKREAIFLVFPIIWLEANRYKLRPSVSTVISVGVVGVLAVVLILSMSIVRGYGNFEDVNSIFDGMLVLPQYINSDIFISAFLVNIEATYLYFHALNSIEMVLTDTNVLAYGSTLIKPLFLMFPREIMPFKPDSILELYTTAYDPAGRELGGSWTIGLFSEFIWNFHLIALLLVILVARVLCKLNFLMLRSSSSKNLASRALYFFVFLHLFSWVRGSGLDQYFLFVLLGLCSVAPMHFTDRLLSPFFRKIS